MKKPSKQKTLFTMLILTAMIITTVGVSVPKAYAIGRIYITPAAIDDTSIGPGSAISVNASAESVSDVFTWQVTLTYDPSILSCTGATTFVGSIFKLDLDVGPTIDNVAGIVTYGSTKIFGAGVSGSGVMAQFTFSVIGRGYSHINYSQPYGADTFLLDSLLHTIPVSVEDSSFNNYVAPPPAKIYIDPPKVIDPSLVTGQRFNVSLKIADAADVQSWAANILYTNTVLMATDVFEGDFLQSVGVTTFTSAIDHGAGTVHLACLLSSGGASGSGTLATITFEVLVLGESAITITDPDLRDSMGRALPFTTTDGYFNNMLIAKLKIDPPEVSGPTYLPGTTFVINVTLEDVESLKSCILNLTYDPTIIQEIGMAFPRFNGEIPVKILHVDDGAGFLWASLTYQDGVSTIPPVTIMKVEFVVLQMGVSPINLTDTALIDIGDNPIVHEVYHGIFIGLIRDVAVLNIVPDFDVVYQNWTVNIDVTVKNKGNVSETFDVQVFYDGNLAVTGTVTDLIPDAETTIRLVWDTTGVPFCHNYSLSAFAGPVPYEFNLGDNALTEGYVKVRIMGDVNGDGKVDMRDIGEIGNAFGSYPGHPKWIFMGDLTRDNRIDMRDIATACIFFGVSCP